MKECPHCKLEVPNSLLEAGNRYSCVCGGWFEVIEGGAVVPYTPDVLEKVVNDMIRSREEAIQKASRAILN